MILSPVLFLAKFTDVLWLFLLSYGALLGNPGPL